MKRKFFYFLLVILVLMILLSSMALADRGDQLKWRTRFSDLKTEELKDVSIAFIEVCMKKEARTGIKVPAGEYIVGEDIPVGTYRIDYQAPNEYSFCSFLAVNEEKWLGFTTILGAGGASEIGKLELPEGTTVTITGGDVYFYTYTGLLR